MALKKEEALSYNNYNRRIRGFFFFFFKKKKKKKPLIKLMKSRLQLNVIKIKKKNKFALDEMIMI